MKKIVNLSLRFTGYLFLLSLIWKGWEASSVYAGRISQSTIRGFGFNYGTAF